MAGRFYWDDDETYSERDAPLIFKYSSPELEELVATIAPDAADQQVANVILTELCMAAEAGKAMSFSRHQGWYKLSHYRSHLFSYTRMMRVVAQIVSAGLALEDRAEEGRRGRQSTLTATPLLFQIWQSRAVEPVYTHGESIVLKSRATKGLDAQLLDFDPTSRLSRELRRGADTVNEMFAGTTFDVTEGTRVAKNLLLFERSGFKKGKPVIRQHHVRLTPHNAGRRIFTGSFSGHGRLYCPLQNVPSEARRSMLINAEPVVETDIKGLHAVLLYNLAGVKMDREDPYTVVGGYKRDHVKLAFVIAINAKDIESAVRALARKLKSKLDYAAEVIEAMQRRHKLIARYFGRDMGIKLMNIDSRIAMGASVAMVRDGFSVLPVHDSWVVPATHIDQAEGHIHEHFERGSKAAVICNLNPCILERNIPLAATYARSGSSPASLPSLLAA